MENIEGNNCVMEYIRKIPSKGREIEESIDKELAPWAVKHSEIKYKDGEKDLEETYRTRFRRDRDRILYSKGFRRLQSKTQVIGVDLGDDFRTRLIHSLEVEQIAVSLADALMLNKDLVSAIALGHDLGHTPFGHAVESLLNKKLSELEEGFSHSVQSVRYLEDQAKRRKGLDISLQVLEGILKHDTDIFDGSYNETYKKQHDCDHLYPDTPGSMEAQVVYWADKIAYLSHDYEDFKKTKIRDKAIEEGRLEKESLQKIESKIITEDIEKIKILEEAIKNNITEEEELKKVILDLKTNIRKESKEIETRDIIRNVIANLIKGTRENLELYKERLKKSEDVVKITNERLKAEIETKNNIGEKNGDIKQIKKSAYQNALIVNFSDEYRRDYLELRKIIKDHYIDSPEVSRSDVKADRMVGLIYDELVKDTRMLPLKIQRYIDDKKDSKHRAVADYIASMTDRQAKNIYKKLFEISEDNQYD